MLTIPQHQLTPVTHFPLPKLMVQQLLVNNKVNISLFQMAALIIMIGVEKLLWLVKKLSQILLDIYKAKYIHINSMVECHSKQFFRPRQKDAFKKH